jgi:hypothetical protein
MTTPAVRPRPCLGASAWVGTSWIHFLGSQPLPAKSAWVDRVGLAFASREEWDSLETSLRGPPSPGGCSHAAADEPNIHVGCYPYAERLPRLARAHGQRPPGGCTVGAFVLGSRSSIRRALGILSRIWPIGSLPQIEGTVRPVDGLAQMTSFVRADACPGAGARQG